MSGCVGCTCDPVLCKGGGVNPPQTMEQALDEIWQEARRIMIQRHRDYGTGNIEKTGELGVAVRITDKLERLRNLYGLTDGRPKEAVGESVDDNWLDSLNYTMIALLLRRGWWGLPLSD